MKWAGSLIISMSALFAPQTFANTIAQICAAHPTHVERPLAELISRYGSVEKRALNPEGYVADMDRVLRDLGFSDALECRRGIPYQLKFNSLEGGEQAMAVGADYTREGLMTMVTLNFDLHKRPVVALFAYYHELTHVCQKKRSQELIVRYRAKYATLSPQEKLYYSTRENAKIDGKPNAEFQVLFDEVKRMNLLGEVESFFLQFGAFKSALSNSPGLCADRSSAHYSYMEMDLTEGIFAQTTLSGYAANFADDDGAFFVSDARLKMYHDRSTSQDFQMRRLNAPMLEFISALGISYREPRDP